MSNIKEVLSLQKKQMFRIQELKQIIINKLTVKISQLAKNGILKCIYEIPHFIFGQPNYNLHDMTINIYKFLIKEGYCVIILDVNNGKLFISWDINDINIVKGDEKKKEKILESIKPLLNIKR